MHSVCDGDAQPFVQPLRDTCKCPPGALGVHAPASDARTGYVFSVEVFEEHRRKGFAKRAFEELEPLARELGLSAIGLYVFAFNTAAQGLYESLATGLRGSACARI